MKMDSSNILGFGVEKATLHYDGFWDWFVAYNDSGETWKVHKSLVICQILFIFGGIFMFFHALKLGGRWPFLYGATILHGFTVECLSYFVPHIDNFWHAQSVVMFIERRLPLYIIFLYPVFYYQACWATTKMRLKSNVAEHLAVGLLTVLIDMPYDIIGVKFLHWVWHDTDPNIADRHYWVPWNSYYFHACFAASFHYFYHATRGWIDRRRDLGKWERGTILSEVAAMIVAGAMGMPGGCLLFIPLYHPLHDFLGVPSEVTSITVLLIFAVIVWQHDRKANRYAKPEKMDFLSKSLIFHLIAHYAVQLGTAIFLRPQDVISIGVHEPIGDCNETVPVETVLKTLSKRKYLCVSDYDEKYYDFHCLANSKVPSQGSYWYTICGTDHENTAEFITVIATICFVAFVIFRGIHFDYDVNLVTNLSAEDRQKLVEKASSLAVEKKSKKKIKAN